jgi:hypothetical protein
MRGLEAVGKEEKKARRDEVGKSLASASPIVTSFTGRHATLTPRVSLSPHPQTPSHARTGVTHHIHIWAHRGV